MNHPLSNLMNITGLHHVTAMASDAQRNLDFYAGTLGMRLVKRTVNFDDPGSYHFYFGDATGTPGSILTFFPWPNAYPGVRGTGEVGTTALQIPAGSTEHWQERLRAAGVNAETTQRFGDEVLRFADPDEMQLELVATAEPSTDHAIRGLHSVAPVVRESAPTAHLLTELFGYRLAGEDDGRARYVAPGDTTLGKAIDLVVAPSVRRGSLGAGSVHHIAFRVPNAAEQRAWREKLVSLGYQVSPVMDRTYFESIYFREPGGVLFEIATDAPGFAIDEAPAELGQQLQLPRWMERARPQIEASLPEIQLPLTV
jgi:glyoxalase family protein